MLQEDTQAVVRFMFADGTDTKNTIAQASSLALVL